MPSSLGGSLGDHVAKIRKRKKESAELLPSMRDELKPLWNYFLDLHNARQHGQGGPSRLSYLEIAAYSHLMLVGLSPWEVQAIRALDSVYFEALSQSEGF